MFILSASNLICHQPVVDKLAHSKDFPIRVVRALFYTRVFFKFKSSCSHRSYKLYKNMNLNFCATSLVLQRQSHIATICNKLNYF